MFAWPKGTKVVVFGNNPLTEKIYYKYRTYYDFVGVYDQKLEAHLEKAPKFGRLGLPVFDTKSGFYRKQCQYKIIVAFGNEEPCRVLLRAGYLPYDDFIPACFVEYDEIDILKLRKYIGDDYLTQTVSKLKNGKDGVILHGNCQMTAIINYLKASSRFNQKCVILATPRVFLYDSEKLQLIDSEALWQNVDWLIYHKIKATNRFGAKLSSENFCEKLKCEANKICLTNLWFTGYFPQAEKNSNNVLAYFQMSGLFPMGDKNANELAKKGMPSDEIIRRLSDEDFYSAEEVLAHVKESFSDMEQREVGCDVKMLDFIKENYNKRLLFHSPNHPTHFVIEEMAERILNKMNLGGGEFQHRWWIPRQHSLRRQDIPIYPSVLKALGMQKLRDVDMVYFSNAVIDNTPLDFAGWLSLYCSACLDCN